MIKKYEKIQKSDKKKKNQLFWYYQAYFLVGCTVEFLWKFVILFKEDIAEIQKDNYKNFIIEKEFLSHK